MLPYPVPTFEQQREEVLQRYRILRPLAVPNAVTLARAAREALGMDVAYAAVTERHRDRFACHDGVQPRWREALDRFCARANLSGEAFCVPDATLDPHLAGRTLLTMGTGLRAFAGAPMIAPGTEERLGTFCVLGKEPRAFTDAQQRVLETFAKLAAETLRHSSASRYAVADLIEAERVKREYYDLAMTDGLTGALNRRAFADVSRREAARAARHGRHLSILMIDIDRFKSVNDVHGHGVGDRVLSDVAACLARAIRSEDALGRLGGEEFAIMLPETGPAAAEQLADRLRRLVRALNFEGAEGAFSITASFGVSAPLPGENDLTATLRRADGALYEAKHGGRDRTVLRAA